MTFLDLLKHYGVPAVTEGKHCTPGRVNLDCPWCGEVGRYHMGYHLTRGTLHCWKCGFHNAAKTLSRIVGKSLKEIKGQLDDLDRGPRKEAARPGKLVVPHGVGPLLPAHCAYLASRGLDPAKAAGHWGAQGLGVAARLAWRVFLPVTLDGQVLSWTTRSIDPNSSMKYVSAGKDEEVVSHKTLLYGEDLVRHSVVVCEGPLDAMRVGPGAVATFGTGFLSAQVRRLARYPYRAVCFDADAAGERRARKLFDQLSPFEGKTHLIHLDSGKDAGSASEKEIKQIRKFFLE